MEILIVDDSRNNRTILEQLLKDSGYQKITLAESTKDAFDKIDLHEATENTPCIDLILMDIVMPDMDGIQACEIIKKSERFRDIPVIMVTARTDEEGKLTGFDSIIMWLLRHTDCNVK